MHDLQPLLLLPRTGSLLTGCRNRRKVYVSRRALRVDGSQGTKNKNDCPTVETSHLKLVNLTSHKSHLPPVTFRLIREIITTQVSPEVGAGSTGRCNTILTRM
jgi:hypothetical protein